MIVIQNIIYNSIELYIKELKLKYFQIIQWKYGGDFLKTWEKNAKRTTKNAIKVANNSTRILEVAADLSTAAATKKSKPLAATAPPILEFIQQGNSLYLKNGTVFFRKIWKRNKAPKINLHECL